jgi:hypothetical protein
MGGSGGSANAIIAATREIFFVAVDVGRLLGTVKAVLVGKAG